jgi:hypothetical protein
MWQCQKNAVGSQSYLVRFLAKSMALLRKVTNSSILTWGERTLMIGLLPGSTFLSSTQIENKLNNNNDKLVNVLS